MPLEANMLLTAQPWVMKDNSRSCMYHHCLGSVSHVYRKMVHGVSSRACLALKTGLSGAVEWTTRRREQGERA